MKVTRKELCQADLVFLCLSGNFLFADSREGKLYSARLHYLFDVVELYSTPCIPVCVAFKDGVIYIADNSNSRIAHCDVSGKFMILLV